MSGWFLLAVGVFIGALVAAAAVREERARRDLKGAKAFVKVARKVWHGTLGNLASAVFIAAVVIVIVYLVKTGRPE